MNQPNLFFHRVKNRGEPSIWSDNARYAYLPDLPYFLLSKLFQQARGHWINYPVKYPLHEPLLSQTFTDGITLADVNAEVELWWGMLHAGTPIEDFPPTYDPNLADIEFWNVFPNDVFVVIKREDMATTNVGYHLLAKMHALVVWFQFYRHVWIWSNGLLNNVKRGRPRK